MRRQIKCVNIRNWCNTGFQWQQKIPQKYSPMYDTHTVQGQLLSIFCYMLYVQYWYIIQCYVILRYTIIWYFSYLPNGALSDHHGKCHARSWLVSSYHVVSTSQCALRIDFAMVVPETIQKCLNRYYFCTNYCIELIKPKWNVYQVTL